MLEFAAAPFKAVFRIASSRSLLLAFGLGLFVLLIWRTGPQLVLGMLARIGWSFPAVVGIYTIEVGVRAAALWRSIFTSAMSYRAVLRIALAGEAVELLTFTGPFLAEPAKGALLARRGLPTADAFAAVATEYLLYTIVSAWMTLVALLLLLRRGTLPPAARPAAIVILAAAAAFIAAFTFAAVSGTGLIVPLFRAARRALGARADAAIDGLARVEDVLITFLHAHPWRLAQVCAIESAAQLLLMLEIGVVIGALGVKLAWADRLIVEGGVKFTSIAFAFIPGQLGASEGVYALLIAAIGMPPAMGLTLALVRRVRGVVVAGVVLAAVTMRRDDWS
jgi:hypothetical protein